MSPFLRLLGQAVLITLLSVSVSDASDAPPWDELTRVSTRFVHDIAEGRAEQAWALLDERTREEVSQARLAQMTAPFTGLLGKLLTLEPETKAAIKGGCGRLIDRVRFESADARFTFEVCPEKQAWKISHFNVEPLRLDREAVASRTIEAHLAKGGLPAPKSLSCPGIQEAAVGSLHPCRLDMGDGCEMELILMIRDGGFLIVGGSVGEGCEKKNSEKRRP
jgi:hypothetical protein